MLICILIGVMEIKKTYISSEPHFVEKLILYSIRKRKKVFFDMSTCQSRKTKIKGLEL